MTLFAVAVYLTGDSSVQRLAGRNGSATGVNCDRSSSGGWFAFVFVLATRTMVDACCKSRFKRCAA